jgi:hypothetical protein
VNSALDEVVFFKVVNHMAGDEPACPSHESCFSRDIIAKFAGTHSMFKYTRYFHLALLVPSSSSPRWILPLDAQACCGRLIRGIVQSRVTGQPVGSIGNWKRSTATYTPDGSGWKATRMTKQYRHRDWLRSPRGLEFLIEQVNAAFPAYKQILHLDSYKEGTGHPLC